ncbi:MBG domain-containing protein [Flavisolibacter nicotianae]|uniref:MBG domain-containing protein n=1 Tax=Flavisolibacter nicotianae TaxID=2364882 RepID=UPI001F09A80F|nr:MBG domain-containing protein [Flavisolibacter nicotianae]
MNGDAVASVTLVSSGAAATAAVGSYPIVASAATGTGLSNYSITYKNGILTINKATLIVTADNKEKYCGQNNPTLTGKITGQQNGEMFTDTYTTIVGQNTSSGNYPIVPAVTGATIDNYNVVPVDGILTVKPINSIDVSGSGNTFALGTPASLSALILPAVAGVNLTFTLTTNTGTTSTYTAVTDASGIAKTTTPITGLALGLYKVTATTASGCATSIAASYMTVYDPNAGFVTGGGWINSPAGAYVADKTLTGKANFGFNAQYKKGSNAVDGNTEFQFNAGNLNFKSSSYVAGTLVIAGAKAIFQGSGTINGTGNYNFMISAIDGSISGGGGVDKFRIKIWNPVTGTIVYDNQLTNTDNNADPITVLGGGSIVIHQANSAKPVAPTVRATQVDLTPVSKLGLQAYPNPAISQFTVKLTGTNTTDAITMIVYNQMGQVLEVKRNLVSGQTVQIGASYKQGTYFVEVIQGDKRERLQVVKTN